MKVGNFETDFEKVGKKVGNFEMAKKTYGSVSKPLKMPSLARSVLKPLKVPSLARSVPCTFCASASKSA